MTTKGWFRLRAKELYHEEGEIEIDEKARVSVSDEGAYVEAWVWVRTSNVERLWYKRVGKRQLKPI